MSRVKTPFQCAERDVTRCVREYLELRHWRPVRINAGAFGKAGMPDYLFLRYRAPMDFFWVEFKAPGGRLGPLQQEWIELERRRWGARVYVVNDIHDFIRLYEAEYGREGQLRLVPEEESGAL